MSLLNIARRIIFWSLDFIKGSPIRNHYNEINQILDNPNSKKSIERRNELLNILLNHAVDTTPFYFDYKNPTIPFLSALCKPMIGDLYQEREQLNSLDKE